MSKDIEQLYAQRMKRYTTAMRNEKPDMIPIRPFVAEGSWDHHLDSFAELPDGDKGDSKENLKRSSGLAKIDRFINKRRTHTQA